MIIDNRPGAGGNVGAAHVARAQPDGYTLMIGTDAMMTCNIYLYKSMPFHPVKDFAPITNAGANIIGLAVNSQVPVKLGRRAHRLCQGQPGQAALRLLRASLRRIILPASCCARRPASTSCTFPIAGGGPAVNDLLGGHINMAFSSLSAVLPHLATGKSGSSP